MRKRFCRSKDFIISIFALPTRCSCMFYLLNLSSYIRHHRKNIYLLTSWIASNKKIYLSSQAPELNVVSMGLSCKNSSFVLTTKNATDGHFTGLHIPVPAMGPPHVINISMITAHGLPVVKVAEVLQIQLSGILCQINCINILLKTHNQIHLYRTAVGLLFICLFFVKHYGFTCSFIISTGSWKELQNKTSTYPLYFFSVGKSKPVTNAGIHLWKASYKQPQRLFNIVVKQANRCTSKRTL